MNVNLGIKKVGFLYGDKKTGNDGFCEFILSKEKSPKIKDYDPDGYIPVRGKKYMSNSSKLYCNLTHQCLPNVIIEQYKKNRIGLYNCTDMPHLEDSIMFDSEAQKYGINGVSPMLVPNTLANVCSGQMAILSGINGVNFTMTSGAVSISNALSVVNLHIYENFIDIAILVSMEMSSAMHSAIRQHRIRTSIEQKLQNSPELGASILVGKSNKDDLATIIYIDSSLSINNTLEDTFNELLNGILNKQIDIILIDSGASFINKSIINSIMNKKGINVPVIYLEEQTGICDNTGSLLSILYSINLFNKKLRDYHNKISTILTCSFDISGYVSIQIVELKN
ncbi:MAG: hypothetical protein LBG80_12480 [Bacteroidales bacterium]|jgi:hypothetical protein|nr:hypothetical protein [Bacteroidales bacterium]